MTSPTNNLAALMPQSYLDAAASPLGPALQEQPLLSIGIDEHGLDTLTVEVEATGAERRIRGSHPSGLELTVDVEPCDLRLPPGTRLRGPAMALGLYQGDYAAGCNALRRWLRSRMPALPEDGDLSHFNTWTAMDADVDEARLLAAADRVGGKGLRYFMLDAGWYPSPRDNFSAGVGNWRVDETKLPGGLEPVAERVRAQGMG